MTALSQLHFTLYFLRKSHNISCRENVSQQQSSHRAEIMQ